MSVPGDRHSLERINRSARETAPHNSSPLVAELTSIARDLRSSVDEIGPSNSRSLHRSAWSYITERLPASPLMRRHSPWKIERSVDDGTRAIGRPPTPRSLRFHGRSKGEEGVPSRLPRRSISLRRVARERDSFRCPISVQTAPRVCSIHWRIMEARLKANGI